jgi:hypothetical protein
MGPNLGEVCCWPQRGPWHPPLKKDVGAGATTGAENQILGALT